jgi:hypothetical protein
VNRIFIAGVFVIRESGIELGAKITHRTRVREAARGEKSSRHDERRASVDEKRKGDADPRVARTHLQSHAGVQDGIGDLRHGARDEEARRYDPDHRRERQYGLDDPGEEPVQRHPDRDGSEYDLLSFRQ